MSYLSLYRKYRPTKFEDVIGQEAVVRTLRNQIKSGRIAHAYLFCGTHGTGKTTAAKIFAKAVNCMSPEDGEPCGHCDRCLEIARGASVNVIEIDAASNNGVDNIREIIEDSAYRPANGKYRVYIIDEVHMLSKGAYNALLKTLEEPPEYVIFILATTEVGRIPDTILSRCQRYDFVRLGTEEILAHLKAITDRENASCEDKALKYIAGASDGSMRDALSLLDKCLSSYESGFTFNELTALLGMSGKSVMKELTEAAASCDTYNTVRIFGEVISSGKDPSAFISEYIRYLRDLLLVSTGGDSALSMIEGSEEDIRELQKLVPVFNADRIISAVNILSSAQAEMRLTDDGRTAAELALIRISRPEASNDINALAERVRILEEKLESGSFTVPSAGRDFPEMPHIQPEERPDVVVLPEVEEISEITDLVNKEFDVPGVEIIKNDASASMAADESGSVKPDNNEELSASWPGILKEVGSPIARSMLKGSVPSLEADGTVVIYVENDMARDILDRDETENDLKRAVLKVMKADHNVKLVFGEADVKKEDLSLNDVLRQKIKIDIIEE